MSLILDALRKSEAERRRGQAPDLFAATLPALGTSRPRRSLGIALAGLAAIALAAVLFWPRQGEPPAPGIDRPQQAGVEAGPAPTAPQAAASGLPAALATPPSAPQAPTEAAAAPATPPSAPVTALAPAAASNPPLAQPAAPLASPASEPATVPAPTEDAIPPIAILTASERASLPPMKLSMHVWNSDPGKRFAIIDGQRIAEGSLLGTSVVEEIRRDGVVLDINGRRVLLSRP